MNDHETTIRQLSDKMQAFIAERSWQCFHTPKNLASSIAIEAAEVMEHFQWLTPEESLQMADQPAQVAEVGEELADVFAYLLSLAHALNIDLAAAFEDKMKKNALKYPPQ